MLDQDEKEGLVGLVVEVFDKYGVEAYGGVMIFDTYDEALEAKVRYDQSIKDNEYIVLFLESVNVEEGTRTFNSKSELLSQFMKFVRGSTFPPTG